ncbi:S49 family peptidase [Hahella ganghwensis]|uniref:S49 family peptidase n=1 Tax=Hahella ganghwensis TaxID=286420 RepID=UPI0003732417|nr:S49 family peptidase [Hahella ganghwensis]
MQLAHLASRLYGTPLLIARPKLDIILSVLGSRIGLPEVSAALPPVPARAPVQAAQQGIAIIPIHGTLVRRTIGLEAASGLMSYADIAARIDAAIADPQVQGILLDMDSPGGEAGGVFELAERIRSASSVKPVWAHANDAAYSAAYAIASAATRLTLSQTAGVGSIGVIALHVDQSVRDAKEGLHYTAIFAGHHKNDFSPHEPLSPQAATSLQTEVNRLYELFVTQVASMRGMDIEAVRATEAGLYFGDEAISAGLADAIGSFDQVLAEFSESLSAERRLVQTNSKSQRRATVNSPNVIQQQTGIPHMTRHEHTDPKTDDLAATHDEPANETEVTEPTPQAPAPAASVSASSAAMKGRGEAQAIAELCLIAGNPQRTAEFLASGMSEAQVRQALLNARAEQPDISSRITADAGTQSTAQPESSPVVAAAKKLSTSHTLSKGA